MERSQGNPPLLAPRMYSSRGWRLDSRIQRLIYSLSRTVPDSFKRKTENVVRPFGGQKRERNLSGQAEKRKEIVVGREEKPS